MDVCDQGGELSQSFLFYYIIHVDPMLFGVLLMLTWMIGMGCGRRGVASIGAGILTGINASVKVLERGCVFGCVPFFLI